MSVSSLVCASAAGGQPRARSRNRADPLMSVRRMAASSGMTPRSSGHRESNNSRAWGRQSSMRGSGSVIETPRLRLRRLRPSDEGDLIALDSDPEVMRHVESRAGVAHGLCALLRMPAGDDIELAYRLARDSWGQGIATEAARALVGHAFGALRLPRPVAGTRPEDLAP